jgi:F-type H+-transporting ATPase subunit delta
MAKVNGGKSKHDTVMDVTAERIARVYATAFLDAVAKTGDSDALVDEFSSLVTDVLDKFPLFEHTLRSELVPHEDKEQSLDRLFRGRASAQVLNFLKVLSKHGRLDLLRPIERVLHMLHSERSGRKEVEVRVAMPVDDWLSQEIKDRVRTTIGAEPILNVVVDQSLIAGMVIRVDDRVYDSSVSTQLEHARRQMIEHVVEKLETEPQRFEAAEANL